MSSTWPPGVQDVNPSCVILEDTHGIKVLYINKINVAQNKNVKTEKHLRDESHASWKSRNNSEI